MTSSGTQDFWKGYHGLPSEVREAARSAHKRFLENPAHPSLRLERLRSDARFWSVRVTRDYRAVAGDLPETFGFGFGLAAIKISTANFRLRIPSGFQSRFWFRGLNGHSFRSGGAIICGFEQKLASIQSH